MTDTTDIKALREAYKGVEKHAHSMRGNPREYQVMTGLCPVNVIEMQAQRIVDLLDQLEAERQRADDAHKYGSERDAENESLMLTVGRLRVEIAALKGDQVPVGFTSESALDDVADGDAAMFGPDRVVGRIPLFTAPQKPVVLPEMLSALYRTGFNESYRAIEVYRVEDVKAAIEAAGGIVKGGE